MSQLGVAALKCIVWKKKRKQGLSENPDCQKKKITKLYLVEDIYLKIFDRVELDGIVWIGLLCKGSNSAIIKKKWKMAILRDV